MMSLCGRVQGQPLSFNVILVLCIWVLVGGLAWADSFDLTDDIGIPHATAGVIVDVDGDEVRGKLDAAMLVGGACAERILSLTLPQSFPLLRSCLFVAPSQDPLHQRFCTFRI
ncbi:MAG: hypothetical protein NT179_01515 [Nitrospirae bacterium]|nr:hypothetical protein [Nitrospirota bacterium]